MTASIRSHITSRITKHVQVSPQGFNFDKAQIPPGKHRLTLQVQDDKYSNRVRSAFTKSMSIGATGAPHKIPYKTLGL